MSVDGRLTGVLITAGFVLAMRPDFRSNKRREALSSAQKEDS